MTDEQQDLSYLYDLEMPEVESRGLTFSTVKIGGTSAKGKTPEGKIISQNQFNAPTFPGFNYDHLAFIPLQVIPLTRINWGGKFTEGTIQQPICVSHDGFAPTDGGASMTNRLGYSITHCAQCPASQFGPGLGDNGKLARPVCQSRAHVYGLAVFYIEGKPEYVPICLDFPYGGIKTVQTIEVDLRRPVNIDGTTRRIPYYARMMEASVDVNTSGQTAMKLRALNPGETVKDPHSGVALDWLAPREIVENYADFKQSIAMVRSAKPVELLPTADAPALLETSAMPEPVMDIDLPISTAF